MSRKLIGKFLILGSLAVLFYTYYPLFSLLNPGPAIIPKQGDYIYIPKINAAASIIYNVDPWIPTNYESALLQGVAAANFNPNYLFAHSSLPPWEVTRANTAFLRLGKLTADDTIIIHRQNQDIKYKVYATLEVWPNQLEVLNQPKDVLILQTCVPLGTSLKRLLIFARI